MKKPSAFAEKALKLRQRAKKRKPDFARPESWRYKRLKGGWHKPRGLDNKMRRKIKGWPPTVNVGYRGPKIARGLHPSGFKEVLVYNLEELKQVDPKTQAIRIAHTVGKRKRAGILIEAKKKKITILNLKELRTVKEEEKLAEEGEKEEALPEEKTKVTEEPEAGTEKPKPKRKRKRKGEEKQ